MLLRVGFVATEDATRFKLYRKFCNLGYYWPASFVIWATIGPDPTSSSSFSSSFLLLQRQPMVSLAAKAPRGLYKLKGN